MLPRLIESWEVLPRAGESFLQERVWFDLKLTFPPKKAEMAKDVAAFANALGGAIIIGANEGPTEPDYSTPLSVEYAARIEDGFDHAVRDYCRPSPTVHQRTIPVPNDPGKVILVVNVEPSVDQPVAVRHEMDADSWRFPLRVGRHTEYILPEQLPLYMNSKARRAKLLLLRAVAAGGHIDFFTVPNGLFKRGDMQAAGHFFVDAVDRDGGGSFVIRDAEGDLGYQSITVPIDDVAAVWLQLTGRWAVRVSGCLEQMTAVDGSSSNELTYVPPTTFVVSPLEKVIEQLSSRVQEIGRSLGNTLIVQHHPRNEPSHDAIAERAYRVWLIRTAHNEPGTQESDWLHARRLLLAERRNE